MSSEPISDLDFLLYSCKEGFLETVQKLIETNPEVIHCKCEKGFTALMYTSWHGYLNISEALIESGASVNQCGGPSERSPLWIACYRGHFDIVIYLLKHRALIDLCDKHGTIPLHAACDAGQAEIAQYLITQGTNIDKACANGSTPLFLAVQNGHDSTVEVLINNKANINAINSSGAKPLWVSCQYGHDDIAQMLISAGANVDMTCTAGSTPLYISSLNGHAHTVKTLLEHRADMDITHEDGATPLEIACEKGHAVIAGILIDSGGEVNSVDDVGCSLLVLVSRNGDIKTAKILIEKGADVNQSCNDGSTALHLACQNNHKDVALLLIERGANIHKRARDGTSPLWIATNKGHIAIVELLLNKGADYNLADSDGNTPLWIASQYGHSAVALVLIKHGACVNRSRIDGYSPLHASSTNNISSMKVLLENGANVNIEDCLGNTPLITSTITGLEEVVNVLLQHGANINRQSKAGVNFIFAACCTAQAHLVEKYATAGNTNVSVNPKYSCLHAAIYLSEKVISQLFVSSLQPHVALIDVFDPDDNEKLKLKQDGNWKVIGLEYMPSEESRINTLKVLLKFTKDINVQTEMGESGFFLACSQGLTKVAKFLYENGGDVTLSDYNNLSPLHTAVIHSRLDTVTWLLTLPEINVHHVDYGGYSTLYRACEHDVSGIILNKLIEKGSDINKSSRDQTPPLSAACSCGNVKAVETLLQNKVLKNQTDNTGNGALHEACRAGYASIIKMLLEYGNDPVLGNDSGFIPLHTACLYLHPDCAKLLLEHGCPVNMKSILGETPLHIVCSVQLRPPRQSIVKSKFEAAVAIIRLLIKHGLDVNSVDLAHETALFAAIRHDNIELADELVSHGCDIHAFGFNGRTLIQSAVLPLYKHSGLQWALAQDIDINTVDRNGHTVLHLSILRSYMFKDSVVDSNTLVQTFLHVGVDWQVRDKWGLTSLDYAVKFPELLDTLLSEISNKPCEAMVKNLLCIAHYLGTYRLVIYILRKHKLPKVKLQTGVQRAMLKGDDIAEYGLDMIEQLFIVKHNMFSPCLDVTIICQNLLQNHGTICESAHTKVIIKHLERFVQKLCDEMQPVVKVKAILAGSMKEGTRTMEASEGDYLLVMKQLNANMFEVPENSNRSFLRLKFKPDVQTSLLPFKCVGGYLSRKSMFNVPYYHVSKILASQEFWESFREFMRLSCMDVRSGDQTIKHLDLVYHDEVQKFLELDVDLTPAVEFPNWYPSWCRQEPLHQEILRTNGCRAVAKWLPEHQDDPTTFRLSLDGCGIQLLEMIPIEYKEAYKLAKILMVLCPNIEHYVEEPAKYIPSFHLKTQLFWLFYDEYKQNPTLQNIKEQYGPYDIIRVVGLTQTLFAKLSMAYKKQWLEDFWIPEYNLLLGSKYGSHGWCASNYASIVHWMLDTDDEEGPQLISKEDCASAHVKSNHQDTDENQNHNDSLYSTDNEEVEPLVLCHQEADESQNPSGCVNSSANSEVVPTFVRRMPSVSVEENTDDEWPRHQFFQMIHFVADLILPLTWIFLPEKRDNV